MSDTEKIHPPADRLTAYVLGRLDGPEMDAIGQHLSSCDSCCRVIEDHPGDAFVLKLRAHGATAAASAAVGEPAGKPTGGFQIPSSFAVRPADSAPLHDQPTLAGPAPGSQGLAGLPQELNDHPRYRVVAALGAGGMGAVYRAQHRLMDRPVALKVIRADLLGSAATIERFRCEVKAAARLASHPNIVAAYDAERAGDTHMLVMEFVEGTDLAGMVEHRGPLPIGEACEYARQAALGLQHAFEDGMVHRDIKPQNLMRTTRGQIKILDFGLARFASEAASLGWMTAPGMVLGSADYIAPEQIDDPHAADIRADLYSLGCTLYFLLAGRSPFPDGSLIQKLLAHREKSPRPLAEFRADVPLELDRIIARMIAKHPDQRFQTPGEVARALGPFADAKGVATIEAGAPTLPDASTTLAKTAGDVKEGSRATRPGQRRRQVWLLIAAPLALVILGGGFMSLILTVKRSDKTTDTERHDAPQPRAAPQLTQKPTSDLLAGPEAEQVGTIARFPNPHDLPEQTGTIVVIAPPKHRGGPSFAYAWDRKSEHPSLLFSRKTRLVQELHAFAVGRDGRQYYLCCNEPSVIQADTDGEKKIFTHTTYVRDLALDEDDNVYFSEASGAGADGKIYRLVPAMDNAVARVELFCTVDPRTVSGYWDGPFAFGRNAKGKVDIDTLYLSSGNCIPAYIFRITRNQGRWSAPTCVHLAPGRIMGLVFTSPTTAYYVFDNKVFRLTNSGSKVAFTVPGVSGLLHVSLVPVGKMIKAGGTGVIAR